MVINSLATRVHVAEDAQQEYLFILTEWLLRQLLLALLLHELVGIQTFTITRTCIMLVGFIFPLSIELPQLVHAAISGQRQLHIVAFHQPLRPYYSTCAFACEGSRLSGLPGRMDWATAC